MCICVFVNETFRNSFEYTPFYFSFNSPFAGIWDPVYTSSQLTLTPHIPHNFTQLSQLFPLRWGDRLIFINANGSPAAGILQVLVNGEALPESFFTNTTITLPWAVLPPLPANVTLNITFGGSKFASSSSAAAATTKLTANKHLYKKYSSPSSVHHNNNNKKDLSESPFAEQPSFRAKAARPSTMHSVPGKWPVHAATGAPINCSLDAVGLTAALTHCSRFVNLMRSQGLYADSRYELAHAMLIVDRINTWETRCTGLNNGTIAPLPVPASETAADQSYVATATNLYTGLDARIQCYLQSGDPDKEKIYRLWHS